MWIYIGCVVSIEEYLVYDFREKVSFGRISECWLRKEGWVLFGCIKVSEGIVC